MPIEATQGEWPAVEGEAMSQLTRVRLWQHLSKEDVSGIPVPEWVFLDPQCLEHSQGLATWPTPVLLMSMRSCRGSQLGRKGGGMSACSSSCIKRWHCE